MDGKRATLALGVFAFLVLTAAEAAAYYHAPLGRWVTRDPIGYNGGSANLFLYVDSGPAGYLDPDGLIQRHHWFMRYHRQPGKGQGMVDRICPQFAGRFNIDDFTTEYTDAEHSWIHSRHGGEVSFTYRGDYEGLAGASRNCCAFLTAMAGRMAAWHEAVQIHNQQPSGLFGFGGTNGDNDPEQSNPAFDLGPWRGNPRSTLDKYMNFVKEACGCSKEQQERINEDIEREKERYLDEIRGFEDWRGSPPGLPPVFVPPIRVPAPIRVPIPVGS